MNRRKLDLLFLVCLAVVLVKSESTIEVDENGDEYEVKRFNIQGRQLNGGHSQCVVTRRKRATLPMPIYLNEASNDEVDDKNNGDTMLDVEQQTVLIYSAPTVNPLDGAKDDEEENEEKSDDNNMSMNENENNEESDNMDLINNENEDMDQEENEANSQYKDDDSDTIEVVQLPILGQLESDRESEAAIALNSTTGQADDINSANSNDIMVIQSYSPPKVDPQTHAVFELVPVDQSAADEEENDENSVDDDFDFKEDVSPITTTAIWSTGDDSLNGNLEEQIFVKKTKKHPKKSQNRKKNKSKKNPKRKNKKRRYTKKRPYRTNVRRPIKRHDRLQNSHKVQSQQNKKSNNNNIFLKKKKKKNNQKKKVTKNHGDRKHAEAIDQGSQTFTRTMTVTQTDNDDDNKNINCIIIRKDPPPTTARPFWNIFGRSANGIPPTSSGHYGKRKRVNIRFVA